MFIITGVNSKGFIDFETVYAGSAPLIKENYNYVPLSKPTLIDETISVIEKINQFEHISPDKSLICIVRDGGSLEKICYFDDAKLCTSVFESKIPILAAIGHADYQPFIVSAASTADDITFNDLINPTMLALYLNRKYPKQ